MAIKYFIFGLVLFVCTRSNGEEYDQEIKSTSSGVFNGDKLHQTIEDSGSESFFQESLKEIGEDDAIGQTKCAIFDLFSSIVNPRLLSPVFDQQVRDFIFSFGYEQVQEGFGFRKAPRVLPHNRWDVRKRNAYNLRNTLGEDRKRF